MPSQVSYVLTARATDSLDVLPDTIQGISRRLINHDISAMLLQRPPGSSLDGYTSASEMILGKGILPVIELYPGDSTPPMRNLAEFCCLGLINLEWVDGIPAFDSKALLDILDGAGRFRIPLDLFLKPGDRIPSLDGYEPIFAQIGAMARKYSHIQVVKLAGLPESKDASSVQDALKMFQDLVRICPKSHGAVSQSLWTGNVAVRQIASDLGIIEMDVPLNNSTPERDPLPQVSRIALSDGITPIPRLPLTVSFYRKGWFSFEVGKVLDSWADRKPFKYYRERPGWLEE